MTEYQVQAIIDFVRREAHFAQLRAAQQLTPPHDEIDSEKEFRRAMKESDER